MLTELLQSTHTIGNQIKAKYREHLGILEKENASGDQMKVLDDYANDLTLETFQALNKRFPLVLISEESGIHYLSSSPEYFIFLDPIDGSNNIRAHFTPAPHLGLSIGMGSMRDLEHYRDYRSFQYTLTRDIFNDHVYVSHSEGSFFVDQNVNIKMSVSKMSSNIPVVGIDLDHRNAINQHLVEFIEKGVIQRRLGSSILDFCQVACGQYDGYISNQARLKITDIAQVHHLIVQSGGVFKSVCYLDGSISDDLNETYMFEALSNSSYLKRCRFSVAAAHTPLLLDKLLSCLYK